MSNYESWVESIGENYLDDFTKTNTESGLNQTPINFKSSDDFFLPIQTRGQKKYVNIFANESDLLTEEYLGDNTVALLVKKEEEMKLSEKVNHIYFASSVNLNKLKIETLKVGMEKAIDFGIDPYSLGLWQSKIFKSQIKFADMHRFVKNDYQIFRVSTLAYDMSGADTIQQLAIVLSSCVQLIRDYEGVLSPHDIFKLTSFEVSLNSNTLFNVVKLQSLRLLIDKLKEVYQVSLDKDAKIYSIASPRYMVSREIWNNLLRLSSVAMSSIMGGADGCIHQSYDLFSTNKGNRLTRNIDLIMENESYLKKVQFPTLGSYSLDKMSEILCQKVWGFFQEIDDKEGLRSTLRSGWLQSEVLRSNQEELKLFLGRNKKMTGVNDFVLLKSLSLENPLPSQEEVMDIQSWWDHYFFNEENEKLCDVEKLVPQQLSSFFEKWQFQADFFRSHKVSPPINLIVEPGQEKTPKVLLVKNLVSLSGCEIKILDSNNLTCPINIVVASDPDGEFVKGVIEKFHKKDHLLFWAGEKKFSHFDGFIGNQTNLMEFYAQIFKKMGESL